MANSSPSFSCFSNPQTCIFLCFGNLDRADDGIGLLIGRKLHEIYEDQVYSEEFVDPIESLLEIKKDPSIKCVIVIDAANFNSKAGSIVITQDVSQAKTRLSTHTIPIDQLKIIIEEENKKFIFIGIQVKDTSFMGKMTKEVEKSVNQVLNMFHD